MWISMGASIMTPNELYHEHTPELVVVPLDRTYSEWWDISPYFHEVISFVPEIVVDDWDCPLAYIEASDRIRILVHKDFDFDGRRTWTLLSVWFEDVPFMITQTAGREARDHRKCFITNINVYRSFVQHLHLIMHYDYREIDDELILDPDDHCDEIAAFYGQTLDGPFKRYSYR
jgi:hypothetical protein